MAGVKWGSGIFIQHILDERGRESWSAPVLYKIHEVSLGLLAGAAFSVSVPSCKICARRPCTIYQLTRRLYRMQHLDVEQYSITYCPDCPAGAGNMQTLLILGSEKAVDQFRSGAKAGPIVLGQDLSLGKKLGFDIIDDTNIFNSREVITHSTQDGHLVDWSLIGRHSLCCQPQSKYDLAGCLSGNFVGFHVQICLYQRSDSGSLLRC